MCVCILLVYDMCMVYVGSDLSAVCMYMLCMYGVHKCDE